MIGFRMRTNWTEIYLRQNRFILLAESCIYWNTGVYHALMFTSRPCLSICLSVCLVCLSVWLVGWLSVCLSVCQSVCLSACMPFCLSVCLSFCLSVWFDRNENWHAYWILKLFCYLTSIELLIFYFFLYKPCKPEAAILDSRGITLCILIRLE